MKYLKLTNTPECLKLAECLVGSPCTLSEFGLNEDHECLIVGVSCYGTAPDNPFLGEDLITNPDHTGWFGNEIILPLETLKLNPFKCMEYGVSVATLEAIDKKDPVIGIISKIFRVEDIISDNILHFNAIICSDNFTCSFANINTVFLDLTSLPNGAEIVEQ